MKCLTSQPGSGFGASCQQSINQATCADGLACDQTGPTAGSCTYYCTATGGHECPAGYTCSETHVGSASGPAVDICRPSGFDLDGGFSADGTIIDDEDATCTGCYDALFSEDGGADSGPAQM